MKLIDPLNIEHASTGQKKEVARWEPSPTGKCPVCAKQMVETQANGIRSYVCMPHRICLPIEDRT